MMKPSVRPSLRQSFQAFHSRPVRLKRTLHGLPVSHHVTSQSQPPLSAPAERWTEDEASRIHIYGSGNSAIFFAHALSQVPNRPPISFLVNTSMRVRHFDQVGRQVEIIQDGISNVSEGFDFEVLKRPGQSSSRPSFAGARCLQFNTVRLKPRPGPHQDRSKDTSKATAAKIREPMPVNPFTISRATHSTLRPTLVNKWGCTDAEIEIVDPDSEVPRIKNLIMSAKPSFVLDAMHKLKDRLRRDSTILFTLTGMGVLEKVNEEVFPDPKTRPNYLVASATHTLWETKDIPSKEFLQHVVSNKLKDLPSFTTTYGGLGTIKISPVYHDPEETARDISRRERSSRFFLNNLLAAPLLKVSMAETRSNLFYRIRKIAITSIVHPMTALLECHDRDIFSDEPRRAIAEGLLDEVASVVTADFPNMTKEYLAQAIGDEIFSRDEMSVTGMLNAVMGGRDTQIDFINGWIVNRGKELGIACPRHEEIIALVKQKVIDRAMAIYDQDAAVKKKQREEVSEEKKMKMRELREKIKKQKRLKARRGKELPQPTWDRPTIRRVGTVLAA